MNFRQRRMLLAVAIAIGVVLLWPPVQVPLSPDQTGLVFVSLFSGFEGTIHVSLLIAECLALGLVGLITYRLLDDKRDE
jgi:hypothetical protein